MEYPSPDEYVAAINKPHDSPEAQRLFQYLGLSEKDFIKSKLDYVRFIEDKTRGFGFLSEEPDIPYHDVGEGPWMLTQASFLNAGVDGSESYAGPLPYEIDFDMSREQIRQLCGKPDRERDKSDSWSKDSHRLVVNYDLDTQAIKFVGIWQPLPEHLK